MLQPLSSKYGLKTPFAPNDEFHLFALEKQPLSPVYSV